MSNTRAIAAVTSTLSALLGRVTQPIGGDAIDGDLLDVKISTKPPDKVREGTHVANQLNLFLYAVQPNAAWRNREIVDSGSNFPSLPLALNLHYLVTMPEYFFNI